MNVFTNEEMKKVDAVAIEKYEIPGIVLMENAGSAVVQEIKRLDKTFDTIHIICGTGNNGGDGYVIARHLYNRNMKVIVYIVGKQTNIRGDALSNLDILKKLDIQLESINDNNSLMKLHRNIGHRDLIVDALFGTGLSTPVEGIYGDVIELINEKEAFTLSVDIPSGIHGDTGAVLKTAVQADKTICISHPKLGNILYPGASYNGILKVKKIGIPKVIIDDMKIRTRLLMEDEVKDIIPKRIANSHKGMYGKANLISGSFGMSGAAILASKAAIRSGLGLLKLYIPESLNTVVTTSIPEAITVPLQEMRKGVIGINQIDRVISDSKESDVITIGPGCGNSMELLEMVKRLLSEVKAPMIIDADGLNALAKNMELLEKSRDNIIVTPHPGEMARMTDMTIEEILDNPVEIAKNFAEKYRVVTILKGARTVIAVPDGDIYINVSGNSGMSTAGSGDVLTGIVTAMVAQGLSLVDAAKAGVYLHGLSGDIMAEIKGEHSLIAGDLVDGLIQSFLRLTK